MKLYLVKENVANEISSSEDHFLEKDVEEFVQKNPEVLLNESILIFGRQVHTSAGKILDLLALDKLGRIIVIELKRGDAPRDMMAQILDYSAWLKKLSERELDKIARDYFNKYKLPYRTLHTAFEEFFKVRTAPTIGSELVNVLFAQDFPDELKNAIEYLTDSGVPIYLLKFNWFKNKAGLKYLLIEKLVGEEEDEEYSNNQSTERSTVISEKYSNRQIFNKAKKYFNDNYLNWASQFDAEWKGFIVFQTKAGDWVSVRAEWKSPEGFVQFAFGLSFKDSQKSLVSRIVIPKKLSLQNKKETISLFNKTNYFQKEPMFKNNYWKNQIPYVKTLESVDQEKDFDFNEDKLFRHIKEETPILMEFVNKLLPQK